MNTIRITLAFLMIVAAFGMPAAAQEVANDATRDLLIEAESSFPGLGTDGIDMSNSAGVVDVSTAWSQEKVRPGEKIVLAVIFDIRETWHINANAGQMPADTFQIPTHIAVDGANPANTKMLSIATFESTIFPKAHAIAVGFSPEPIQVFDGKAVAYVPIKVAESAKPGEYTFELTIGFQACDDQVCLNPVGPPLGDYMKAPVTLHIVGPGEPVGAAGDEDIFANYQSAAVEQELRAIAFNVFDIVKFDLDASGTGGLVLLWLVAALGGFLLNLTPCVLPVIPIKIIGLSQAAGNRGKCFVLGLTMALGVVAFWLALGGLIATVSGFTATNQLFQFPAFTIGVGVIIAAMAVGMCGLFTVRLPQWVYKVNPKHDSLHGSFGFGVMTAILSTPCTAPFMGGAAAWAATQNPGVTLTTFVSIGGGMALPYLVLSAFPALVNKMPRTGPASELIKQVMGLLMLAAAAYFIGTGLSGLLAEAPDPPTKIYWWPVMLLVMAAGAWLAWRTIRITPSMAKRVAFVMIGVLFIAGGAYGGVRFTEKGPIDWVYYTEDRFDDALADGKVVLLDFTAEWCLNCKTLEHGVLNQKHVAALLQGDDVVPMKIDITGKNPQGRAKMQEVNSLTIPLLMVYSPDGSVVFRSDFYDAAQVINALHEAGIKVDGEPMQAASK